MEITLDDRIGQEKSGDLVLSGTAVIAGPTPRAIAIQFQATVRLRPFAVMIARAHRNQTRVCNDGALRVRALEVTEMTEEKAHVIRGD